jgi:hypothetical protein
MALARAVRRTLRRTLTTLLAGAALSLPAAPVAQPAELSAFAAGAKPGELWGSGFGGMLTITLFNMVHGEVEGARQSGELDVSDGSLWTLSGKAYLGPTFGRIVPYAGLGAGVYLQSLPVDDDQGTLGLVFAGAKLKFPFGLVLRGEYQWVDLPDLAPKRLDDRYLFAVGLSF